MSEARTESSPVSPAKRPVDQPSTSSDIAKRVRIAEPEPPSSVPSSNGAPPANDAAGPSGAKPPKNKKGDARRDAAGWAKSRRGKEKVGRNVGRRRGTRGEGEGRADEGEDGADKAPRLPKRQCALLIGFCGTGCAGMQMPADVRTIEGVLFDALVRAGAVSQDNADDPVKVNLGRAARTDAGVHAAGNVVSMKIITQIPDVPDLVACVNELLPPEIRLWGYVRVQNSFSARVSCDSRKYTYFFPSYLLIPPKPGSGLHKALQSHAPSSSPSTEPTPDPTHSFWEGHVSDTKEDNLRRKRQWRAGPEMMERLRATAAKFEGTHNFHNFTVGRDFGDRSTQRHMKKIEIADPAVFGDTEWISVMFHGQSFMLHQRKMMASLVLSCRTGTPAQVIDELYGPRHVFIPKMPSLGLLLEHPIFDSYNRKVEGLNMKLSPTDADFRPPIDFDSHAETIAAFKQAQIYDRMRSIEGRGGVFDAWVRSVDSYTGGDLGYLNTKGIIPASAVIKKGERRAQPFREKKRFDATDYSATGNVEEQEREEEEEEEGVLDKAKLADMEG